MKRPLLNEVQRFILRLHRDKSYSSYSGTCLELFLARKRLQREIHRAIIKIFKLK